MIIAELERLDKIQYNVEEPPKLNEKVIENKKRKLKETWYRMLSVYKKEDESRYTQLKRLEMEYDAKRVQLVKKYEAVNSTKQVNLEEIPLPFCADDTPTSSTTNQDITANLTRSNLREPAAEYLSITGEMNTNLKVPGCPSSVPPSADELEEDARLANESKNAEKDLDEFLKEVDQVEKMVSEKTTTKESATANAAVLPPPIHMPPLPPMLAAGLPPKPSNHMPNAAPFLLNPMGLLNHPHLGKKLNMPIRPPMNLANKFNPALKQQLQTRKEPEKLATTSTIEAKPQLRNLSADVTKFLPTSLRIKRQETRKLTKPIESEFIQFCPILDVLIISNFFFSFLGIQSIRQPIVSNQNKPAGSQANKDIAYAEFMKELNGLI